MLAMIFDLIIGPYLFYIWPGWKILGHTTSKLKSDVFETALSDGNQLGKTNKAEIKLLASEHCASSSKSVTFTKMATERQRSSWSSFPLTSRQRKGMDQSGG